MTSPRICPDCGGVLPARAPWGLCPKCMFSRAAANGSGEWLAEEPAPPSQLLDKDTAAPQMLGDYELLEPIGQGAVGIVYKARQMSLDRIVAVKLLASSALASPEVVHRFRTEAVAAGSLQHPNIVAVHEVGLAAGQHYLVMDYVAGSTLADLVRQGPLSPVRAAQLVRTIAEALHFAHERRILHRDLKPSNVLLDAEGQPRVTDFGLAKRLQDSSLPTAHSVLTLTGQAIGSPGFMPPEQASGQRGQISRRSDVYGLGAILYYLITGRAPFAGGAVVEVLHQVVNEEPLAPRLLNRATPPDLQTICLKCLEKEPERRYPTAQALAEELGRFLRDEPILARASGTFGKAWRWCRRKPVVAGLGATALSFLMIIGVGSPLALYRINQQWLAALQQTRLAELTAYAAHVHLAQQYLEAGNLGRTHQLLDLATNHSPQTPDPQGWEWSYLREQSRGDPMRVLEKVQVAAKLTISPDGRWLAAGLRYGPVHLWDLPAGKLRRVLGYEFSLLPGGPAAFSPDSHWMSFKVIGGGGQPNRFVIWDLAQEAERIQLISTNLIGGGVFVPGGRYFVAGESVGIELARRLLAWDLTTGHLEAAAWLGTKGADIYIGNDGVVTPEDKSLLIGDVDGKVRIFTSRLEPAGSFEADTRGITAMAISPDGHFLATAADGRSAIRLWDTQSAASAARSGTSPQPMASLEGHHGWIICLSFSRDGRLLASGSTDHSIRIWDVQAHRQIRTLLGHENHVISVQFAPDNQLYSSARDGLICAWSLDAPVRSIGPDRRATGILDFSMPLVGQRLAAVHTNRTVLLIEPASRTAPVLLPELGADNAGVCASPDGRLLYVTKCSGEIVAWDIVQHRAVRRLPMKLPGAFSDVCRDGKLLLVVDQSHLVRIWLTSPWKQVAEWSVGPFSSCAFAPDGRQFATGDERGLVRLWDPMTGKQLRQLLNLSERATSMAYSPDGKLLVAASEGGPVAVWELASFRSVLLRGHPFATRTLAFSPDSRRLATGSEGTEAVKIWDTATWMELVTLARAPGEGQWALAFLANGNGLTGLDDNGLLVWQTPQAASNSNIISR
jgi:eukaryotic-like serine/threonine-protein kinase